MASLLSECRFILLPSLPAAVMQWYTSYTVVIVVSAPTARTVVTLTVFSFWVQTLTITRCRADLTGCRSTSQSQTRLIAIFCVCILSFFLLLTDGVRQEKLQLVFLSPMAGLSNFYFYICSIPAIVMQRLYRQSSRHKTQSISSDQQL